VAWRLRLHHRVVIPFAVIAVAATTASAALGLSVLRREVQRRTLSQIANTSEVLSRGGFALSPAILRSVKAITGVEVITLDASGSILSTTLDPSRVTLARTIAGSPLAARARASTSAVIGTAECGAPCHVAYRAVADRPGAVVAVVIESSETAAVVRTVSRTIAIAAAAGVLALVLVSRLVARRVTAPIDDLVRFTHDVAGRPRGRAREGGDEIGRLGRAFNDMLDRLDASQSALVRSEKLGLAGVLAARVAHDLRNPLASMKINAQLLEPAVQRDPQTRELMSAVLQDISQVESVIRDLIELARPGELKRAPADLASVIRRVTTPLEARLRHRKVHLTLDLPDRPLAAQLDTERFGQALLNVIINAAEAMPEGGALVIAGREESGRVVIEIDDEGVGIDPAIAERVFDPFVSSKPEGVGLGLVNARAVIEGHGGTIALVSRQPRGTRARITVPVA
jgi:signal transduction histidine kinase